MKIRARLYGTTDRQGKVRSFEVVDRIPEGAELLRLDPEQRTGDDDVLYEYDFYRTEDGDYIAHKPAKGTEPTPRIIETAISEAAAYDDEDAYISDLMESIVWDEEYVEPNEEWLRQTYRAARRSVKDIMEAAGLKQWQLCQRFGIPKRTVEDWSRGARQCPSYVMMMMQELLGLWSRV